MNTVFSSLFPVVLLTAIGFAAGRLRWLGAAGIKDLSNLVFMLLTPALLFRTMSRVKVDNLDFTPALAFFMGVGVLFLGTLVLRGFSRRSAVLALAGTFGNTVMIGIPLVSLAYGEAGLVTLFTLFTFHTVLLLTCATVALELAVAREAAQQEGAAPRSMVGTVFTAIRNAVLHPVPLSILAGLLFAQLGLIIPEMLDKPLQLLGHALGPIALLLVGATLANTPLGLQARGATGLAVTKNLLHPLLVAAAGWSLGLSGVPLAVMVVTAALPIGANVFMFSQRYDVAQELITASVAVSTLAALVTLSLVVWLAQFL